MTTSTLTGIVCHNEMNLTGTKLISTFSKLTHLRTHIVANYILPLYSEQWDVLNTNKFLIDENIRQLERYYNMYKTDDLLSFVELLKILKIVIDKHSLLFEYESKLQSSSIDKNSVVNMVYKTTKIRLMPEYDIYHSIVGKPDIKQNESYNDAILQDIRRLMVQERITFEKIRSYITQTYKLVHINT